MKAEYTRHLLNKETTFREENRAVKKFPEIDPDEKKRKEEEIENPLAARASSTSANISYISDEVTVHKLMELASPIIKEIKILKDRGITKTHFTIQTKNFGEVDVYLTMYDTAPHSFHLRLLGPEKLAELSMRNQNILQNSIKDALPKITLHIAQPLLRKKDRYVTKSKKGIEKTASNCYGAISRGKSL